MKNIELLSVSCTCCGAKLEGFQGKDEVKCDFCENTTKIIRPIIVHASDAIIGEKKDKFTNLIAIMEQSMVAENYKEAYDYCNKALEIDPSCGKLWENKAICCFWLRTDNDIIESQAKEITTYLNAAKNNDPNSTTYNSTVDSLSFNLYFAAWYRYSMVGPDVQNNQGKFESYSFILLKRVISYLNMMEIAFDLSPNELYLKDAVLELSNHNKVLWLKTKNNEIINLIDINTLGTNPSKLRDRFIVKLKKINNNYQEPSIEQKSGCFIATATMGSYGHPEVMELRYFRDNWILQKSWGERFVKWYYHYGAIAAKYIENNNFLKKISYCFIVKPLVFLTRILKK